MKKYWLFAGCLCLSLTLSAQKSRRSSSATRTADVATLIADYRFGEAAELLQKEIAAARRAHRETAALEAQLATADMGDDMMNGIEKVIFVDSFVVDRDRLLSAYRLGANAGHLLPASSAQGINTSGETVFINDLDDTAWAATGNSSGERKIGQAFRMGNRWSPIDPLPGLATRSGSQDYPYVLSDGTTLYFAEKGPESLGGYDLFVTRYNASDRQYVKPENLGMPFNSPFDDYLLAIDEEKHLGWFASNRYQPEGKVCVYLFIPNDIKDIYSADALDEDAMRGVARYASASWTTANAARRAQALQQLNAPTTGKTPTADRFAEPLVINDQHVYTTPANFRKPEAAKLTKTWNEGVIKQHQAEKALDDLRQRYAAQPQEQAQKLGRTILALENSLKVLKSNNAELLNQIRKIELQ